MKISNIIYIIIAVVFFVALGVIFNFISLDAREKSLKEQYDKNEQLILELQQKYNIDTYVYDSDKAYFDELFPRIFSFYSIGEMNDAKKAAQEAGLPENFINKFYDLTDYYSNAYAQEMLDVILAFSGYEAYLIDLTEDNKREYLIPVTLDLVSYSGSVKIMLHMIIEDEATVTYMQYYQIK